MTDAEFNSYYPEYLDAIEAIARKIAKSDDDRYDELLQVGRIALWQFDLAAVKTNLRSCIRSHLRNRMFDYLRQESSAAHQSLTTMLEHGDQIAKDGDGDIVLIGANLRERQVEIAEYYDTNQSVSEGDD